MIKPSKPTGRPPKNKTKTKIYESNLYVLLQETLPRDHMLLDGRINTEKLSESLKFRRYTVYRWFSGKNMSPRAVLKLVELSTKGEGSLTKEMLLPFCGL